MSFPRYPAYKDSGVEWLAKVPTHWELKRLRRVIDLNPSKSEIAAVDKDSAVSFLPMEAVGDDGSLNLERTRAIRDVEAGYTYFQNGDVTFAKITPCFENGKGAVMRNLIQGVGFGTTELVVARPKPKLILPEYLHQIFTSRDFRQLGESVMYGAGGQKRVPDDFVRELYVALPDIEEQAIICEFLKSETAKIDALVAEQEKLMALLKEKRQAVISRAVTKGLDPTVPMKDSGVDWLGMVPAHWGVQALKHVVSTPITDGPHETPNFLDEGIPFVSAEAVSAGIINFSKIRSYISAEDHLRYSKKYRPQVGDIYMVKSGATTGVTAIVENKIDFNIWSPLAAIRCSEVAHPYFILNFMRSKNFQEAVTLNWSFGTQQNIGMGVIENLNVPLPPVAEQIAISEYIGTFANGFDELVVESLKVIELLHQRRSALISAAVTGKIDVRGVTKAKAA